MAQRVRHLPDGHLPVTPGYGYLTRKIGGLLTLASRGPLAGDIQHVHQRGGRGSITAPTPSAAPPNASSSGCSSRPADR